MFNCKSDKNYFQLFLLMKINYFNVISSLSQGLDEFNKVKYAQALAKSRKKKLETSKECSLLTYSDIQECIDSVNAQCDEGFEGLIKILNVLLRVYILHHIIIYFFLIVIEILHQLNRAVSMNNHENMMKALNMITEKFDILTFPKDAPLLQLFKKRLIEKESDESGLWLDDVETIAKAITLEIKKIEESTSRSYIYIAFIKLNYS